jgi:hypothetical protein
MKPAELHVRVSRLVLHSASAPALEAAEIERSIAERLGGNARMPGDALASSIAQAVALAVTPRVAQAQAGMAEAE